jgi:hypothetical protein
MRASAAARRRGPGARIRLPGKDPDLAPGRHIFSRESPSPQGNHHGAVGGRPPFASGGIYRIRAFTACKKRLVPENPEACSEGRLS